MTVWTYEKQSPKLIKVLKDGVFAGWLTQHYHRSYGVLRSTAYTYWDVTIDGVEIQDTGLRNVKEKIEGKRDLKTGRPIPPRMTPDQIFKTEADAEGKIAELLVGRDPGEVSYKIVAEVNGWSIDAFRRDGSYSCTL